MYGLITAYKPTLHLQIASIFYYLCVVTLQYVAPIILCLYVTLMYKTLGGYRWTDLYRTATASDGVADDECGLEQALSGADRLRQQLADLGQHAADDDESLLGSARLSLDRLKAVSVLTIIAPFRLRVLIDQMPRFQIFTTDVYRGLFGFATWWSCFVWFATSSLGMVYQSYFTQV